MSKRCKYRKVYLPFSNDFIDGVHVTDQVVGGPDHGREGRSGAGGHGAVLHWQL